MTADWTKTPDWERLKLAGRDVECAMVDVKVRLDSGVDVKKSKGKKKARVTDDGEPPAEINVEIQLLPKHLPAFAAHRNVLRPRAKNAAREPIQFAHPNTEFWGITAVTIKTVDSPMPEAGGLWRVSFKAIEWSASTPEVKAKATKDQKPSDAEEWQQFAADPESPATSGAAENNIFVDLGNTLLEE